MQINYVRYRTLILPLRLSHSTASPFYFRRQTDTEHDRQRNPRRQIRDRTHVCKLERVRLGSVL
jgi:hypothetical protein